MPRHEVESLDSRILRAIKRHGPIKARFLLRCFKWKKFFRSGGTEMFVSQLQDMERRGLVKCVDKQHRIYDICENVDVPDGPPTRRYFFQCRNCGREFEGSVKNITNSRRTCSDLCKIELRKKINKTRIYSEESKKHTKEQIAIAHKNNPKLKKGEENCTAKPYSLISPEGDLYEGICLAEFVRQHEDELYNKWAYYQLARLAPRRKGKGVLKSWHKWTWNTETDAEDDDA